MTITPTLRLALSLTMIALTITMTSLSIALALGVFATVAARLAVCALVGLLLGFNLALLCVSFAERYTLRRRHQQRRQASV